MARSLARITAPGAVASKAPSALTATVPSAGCGFGLRNCHFATTFKVGLFALSVGLTCSTLSKEGP